MTLFADIAGMVLAAADAAHGADAVAHAAQALGLQKTHAAPYLFLIPLLPLLGAAFNAFFGKRLQRAAGEGAVSKVAIAAMAGAFLVAARAFVDLWKLPVHERYLDNFLWNMFTAGEVRADLAFALDPLSMTMVLIITFIGTLIHIYASGYMAKDPGYWRFFSYLNLFVFSMLLLVMGDNFVVMFFGWEGVGLCSYLLIGFWYEDVEKAKAAMKAFVTNRVGDFGFVLGLFLLFWALGGSWRESVAPVGPHELRWVAADPGGYSAPMDKGVHYERFAESGALREVPGGQVRVGPTLSFRELRDQLSLEGTGVKARLASMTFFGMSLLALVGILLFVGATAKSAQIPLYVWLPDAMAGPTPVSALIHAATMVTAGVYMVARLNFLFALSTTAMTVIAVTGAATALFAASIGFVQNDIKKVLAYSTVSQLGFMFIGVGVGAYWAGVYHLLTHAFFKACLFLGAGSVIVGCHHEQDMQKMGGLKRYMPLTEKTYRYACIAISGFPIANGFFSKDEILWGAFTAGNNLAHPLAGKLVWLAGWLAALGTSFYMWRSYYLTFSGEYRGAHAAAHGGHGSHDAHGGLPHESPRAMTWVLATLAIGCFLTIGLGFWAPLGIHPLFEGWLEPVLAPSSALVASRWSPDRASHALEYLLIAASVGVALVGWLLARALYKDAKSAVPVRLAQSYAGVHRVLWNKYYVDELYQRTVLAGVQVTSRALSAFDRIVIDGLVNGVAWAGRFVCAIEGAIDKYLVDGAVHAVAGFVMRAGRAFRRLQTGRIQHYLYAAVTGALAVAGIHFLLQ